MRAIAVGSIGVWLVAAAATTDVRAHGLIEDPPARNWFCGLDTPPDRAARGDTDHPVCREVFAGTGAEGYQFMSVLTHDRGRGAVRPLPDNVCGFDSESFGDGATPWDRAADWPTSALEAGRNKFTWNISWGPHFSDTEEFRYWMTRPDFTFRADRALAWSDFESEPFCALDYDDASPRANPDVIARPDMARFDTYCDVPARDGHHVIYAEWGRNEFTFERFHGCVDVAMGDTASPGSPPPVDEPPLAPPEARIERNPSVDRFVGGGAVRLSAAGQGDGGRGSGGADLADTGYRWSVSAPDASAAVLGESDSANAVLSLGNPSAVGRVTVTLRVVNAAGSDTTSVTFEHAPADGAASWTDIGPLVEARVRPAIGERVQLRMVDRDGVDVYLPADPLVLDAATVGPRDWPLALAGAVAASDPDVRIGRLDRRGRVKPRRSATMNRVFAPVPSDYVSAFVAFERDEPTAECTVTRRPGSNGWWAGFDVATDAASVRLDFGATGVELAALSVDAGVFDASVEGQTLTLRTPPWVSVGTPGYFGLRADGLPALAEIRLDCG